MIKWILRIYSLGTTVVVILLSYLFFTQLNTDKTKSLEEETSQIYSVQVEEEEADLNKNEEDVDLGQSIEEIKLYINKQELCNLIFPNCDDCVLKLGNWAGWYNPYVLEYTVNKREGRDYITYYFSPVTGNIFDDFEEYWGNIFYDGEKKLLEVEEAEELLKIKMKEVIPDGYELSYFTICYGNYVFRCINEVETNEGAKFVYSVNPINGAVYNYRSGEYICLLK